MKCRIKYCRPCGYRPHAERLANKIRQQFGIDVELVAGSFGVYKVWVDDRLIFDKYAVGGWIGWLGFGAVPADDDILVMFTSQKA